MNFPMALCLGIAMVIGSVSQTRAFFSVENRFGGTPDIFSDEFKKDYKAAIHSRGSNSLIAFEKMLEKYKLAHEQAELEVTLGSRYSFIGGMKDPEKAVEHLGKALTYDLPVTVRLQVHLWRGNSFEQLKRRKEALLEYLNGMLTCLDHPLPKTKPVAPVIELYHVHIFGDLTNDPAFKEAERKRLAEREMKIKQFNQARFDAELADFRFYLIDACQRVGGDQFNVRTAAHTIVQDEARIQQLVDLFKEANKRAWN